jgi:hypothetical protein
MKQMEENMPLKNRCWTNKKEVSEKCYNISEHFSENLFAYRGAAQRRGFAAPEIS